MPSKTIRVLCIDDMSADYEMIRDHLAEPQATEMRFRVDFCNDHAKALRALVSNSHDLFFIDQNLQGFPCTGIELIEKVNQAGCVSPLVLLTGLDDDEIEYMAEQAGAAFFLNKNHDLTSRILQITIRFCIRNSRRIYDLQFKLEAVELSVAEMVQKVKRLRG